MSLKKILKNIEKDNPGPFSNFLLKELRFEDYKKMKLNNNMSTKLPNIQLVDSNDEDSIEINNDTNTNLNNIDLIQDSDLESISTAENENVTPIKTKKNGKMPFIQSDEFKYFSNNVKQKPIISKNNESDSDPEPESDSESEPESEPESIKTNKPKLNSRENEKKKQELLIKLLSLEKKGVTLTKSYSLKSSLEELEFEYETQRYSAEVDASVHFQQKILMAAITGVEFLNKKFDPIGAKLEGWSESVMDNIVDYEEIFKKLHEKYQERASMPPELQLLVTLVGSGFMFHLTNTLFKSSLPGLGDALKSNPDIMNNIMGAMGKAMNSSQQPQMPMQMPQMPMQMPQMPMPSQSTNDMSGPSMDLSSMMNKFQNGPPQPMSQQAPKQVDNESDRFSIASSSELSDIKSISISKSGKKSKGKSIKI